MRRVLAFLLILGSLQACTEEEIIFRDRQLFDDPAVISVTLATDMVSSRLNFS